MMRYRNTEVKVRSPDFFDIVTAVLIGDTLALHLFIICIDYILWTSIDIIKENGFAVKKARSRRYSAESLTDTDYADCIALLANTPAQAESLLRRMEQAAEDIGLCVNTNKTEYMVFKRGVISTVNGDPWKLVDKFMYLSSSVSSTESDANIQLEKERTAIDRLSIIWKSDLSDKIKGDFFQAVVVSIQLNGCTTWWQNV